MLRIFLTPSFLYFTFFCFGQNRLYNSTNQDSIVSFSHCDLGATYEGGLDSLRAFIQRNMDTNCVFSSYSSKIEGKVTARVLIFETGKVGPITIIKEVENCPSCSDEVIRVLQSVPAWNPKLIAGKPVNSFIYIPINFSLQK